MLAERGLRSVVAVEPSDDMRAAGIRDCRLFPTVHWQVGCGEDTGLDDASVDLVTMASSFHWVDFAAGVREFHRVLRPGGRFVALWNPRLIEVNPLLVEIERQLHVLHPALERKSSGRSGRTEGLTERLAECGWFDDVLYLEGRHTARLTVDAYIGAWRSVNDVQAQMGPAKFGEFLDFVHRRLRGLDTVETTYLTRAWAARRAA
jgi:SAM-dependent methyltransferase